MKYEHPLAYLVGIEGLALLRGFAGELDREFVDARLAEVRRLLDDESLADAAVSVGHASVVDGYRVWSETYDGPERNGLFDVEEPYVRELLDARPKGVLLDAACGTGRYAEYAASAGHQVVGVDTSPDMLARARTRVPDGEFILGDLTALPVDDDAVDVVVCALALAHVPDLRPVFAEFARVLRPGGHLVTSDIHHELVLRGSVPAVRLAGDRPARLSAYRHLVGDYLRAALPVGLQVRRCEEPRFPPIDDMPDREPTTDPGPWDVWPWSLAALVPDAARASNAGVAQSVIWDFELAG